jgi:hypothetical protein
MDPIIGLVVLAALTFIPFVAAGGVRRWPWRYAILAAAGWMVVLVAGRLTVEDVDPYLLVWAGAAGGALVMLGWERGERARARRSAAILEGRTSALD